MLTEAKKGQPKRWAGTFCACPASLRQCFSPTCSTWPRRCAIGVQACLPVSHLFIGGTVEPPGRLFLLGLMISARNGKGSVISKMDRLGFLSGSHSKVWAGAGDGQRGGVGRLWVNRDNW